MNIKKNILNVCKEKGISAYKLEKAVGLSHGYIGKLDKSRPSSEKLQKIANYLDVPIEQLLKSEDDLNDPQNKSINVDVDTYIKTILSKLRRNSTDSGVMYLNGKKLSDTQIELLADDLESALNRVIKLSERSKSE